MSNETKAGLLWKCPHDSAFYFGLAHDCGYQDGKDGCTVWNEWGCRPLNPYLCIPVAEAREFLTLVKKLTEPKVTDLVPFADEADDVNEKAEALLATLPKED